MIQKLIFFIVLIFSHNVCFSASLVADLSTRSIGINTGFTGAEIFVFGSFEGENDDDLVVLVEGPKTETTLYKKEYTSGIWINKDSVKFIDLPSFYLINVSDEKVKSEYKNVFIKNHIGFENLNLNTSKKLNKTQESIWKQALERTMKNNEMWVANYNNDQNLIEIIENKLFRAPLTLPSTVLPGDYEIKVYHLRNGEIHSQKSTSMKVRKIGFEAKIYNFAHNYSILYGIFAIIMAVAAGYIAAFSFRRI